MATYPTPNDFAQTIGNGLMAVIGGNLIFAVVIFAILLFLIFKTKIPAAGKMFLVMIVAFSMISMGIQLPPQFLWLAGAALLIGGLVAAWGFTKLIEGN